jgi:hypothetical protein
MRITAGAMVPIELSIHQKPALFPYCYASAMKTRYRKRVILNNGTRPNTPTRLQAEIKVE